MYFYTYAFTIGGFARISKSDGRNGNVTGCPLSMCGRLSVGILTRFVVRSARIKNNGRDTTDEHHERLKININA